MTFGVSFTMWSKWVEVPLGGIELLFLKEKMFGFGEPGERALRAPWIFRLVGFLMFLNLTFDGSFLSGQWQEAEPERFPLEASRAAPTCRSMATTSQACMSDNTAPTHLFRYATGRFHKLKTQTCA